MEEFSQKYGDEGVYEMEVLGERDIVCCSWEVAQEVWQNRPFRMIRGKLDDFHAKKTPMGMNLADGKQWQQERRLMHPFFSEKAVAEPPQDGAGGCRTPVSARCRVRKGRGGLVSPALRAFLRPAPF